MVIAKLIAIACCIPLIQRGFLAIRRDWSAWFTRVWDSLVAGRGLGTRLGWGYVFSTRAALYHMCLVLLCHGMTICHDVKYILILIHRCMKKVISDLLT